MPIRIVGGKCLVTGGSGFIGSHLVSALLREGWKVRCLLRKSSPRNFLPLQKIEVVEGDLLEEDSLAQALQDISWVFHLAGIIKARRREDFFLINQVGTQRLLGAIRNTNPPLEGFIYISSLSAIGPSLNGHLLNETEQPQPVSYYGESKLAGEGEVHKFAPRFPVIIIRPAVVYGPREREILLFVRLVQQGLKLHLGGGEKSFSVVHVDDLVQAILLATHNPSPGLKTYLISDGHVYNWQEALVTIAKILKKSALTIKLPIGLAKFIIQVLATLNPDSPLVLYRDKMKELNYNWVCDIAKAQAELGYKPRFDLRAGMEHTINWYRKQKLL